LVEWALRWYLADFWGGCWHQNGTPPPCNLASHPSHRKKWPMQVASSSSSTNAAAASPAATAAAAADDDDLSPPLPAAAAAAAGSAGLRSSGSSLLAWWWGRGCLWVGSGRWSGASHWFESVWLRCHALAGTRRVYGSGWLDRPPPLHNATGRINPDHMTTSDHATTPDHATSHHPITCRNWKPFLWSLLKWSTASRALCLTPFSNSAH